MSANQSTLIAKSKEHFSAYNLLDRADHFLLLRTRLTDSRDHLLALLLFVWLLFLSLLHGSSSPFPPPKCQLSSLLFSSYSLSDLIHHTHGQQHLMIFHSLHLLRVRHSHLLHVFLLSIPLSEFTRPRQ